MIMCFLYIFLSFVISVTLAMIVIPRLLIFAANHSLYDEQDERKKHIGDVPRIGGVSFIPSILLATMFVLGLFYMFEGRFDFTSRYPNHSELYFLFCSSLFLYLGGVKDDLVGMRYRYKFVIQIISSAIITFSGLFINNFYGLFGIYEISPWVGMPLTLFLLVFIINSINLIDGLDGLVSSISFFAFCVYGTLFLLNGSWVYTVIAISSIGVLIPFFYYNVFGNAKKGSKIFMGDSGSQTLGLILGFLAIRFARFDPQVVVPYSNAFVIAISPLLVPILDVFRVILARMKRKQSIFEADRSHIHHKLLKYGLDDSSAMIFLLFISSLFCILNFVLMFHLNTLKIFAIDITLWTLINIYISFHITKKRIPT